MSSASKQSSKTSGRSSSNSKRGSAPGGRKIDAQEVCILQMKVRDEWSNYSGSVDILQAGHDTFVQFVMDVFNKKLLDDYPSVKELLELHLGSHPDDFSTNPAHVHAILKENKNARTYRISAVCHSSALEGDSRLRNFVEHLFLESFPAFSIYTLFNEFFTHFTAAAHSTSKSKYTTFGTKPATTFERLLLLSFLAEESTLHSRTPKSFESKKRKFRDLDPLNDQDNDDGTEGQLTQEKRTHLYPPCHLEQFYYKNAESSQRAGKVIQVICRAWNIFAQHLHFEDIDKMTQPYIRYGGSPLRAQVIMDRSEGYMPLTSKQQLVVDEDPVLVTDHTFPHVTDYSTEVDACLRDLALAFLNDIRRGVFSSNLYRKDGNDFHRRYKDYSSPPDSLPARFKEFLEGDAPINQVRATRRLMLGIPSTSTQHQLDHQTRVPDTHTRRHGSTQTPKKLPNVSAATYKKRQDAVTQARHIAASGTGPSIESAVSEFSDFYSNNYILYSASFNQLETLLLSDQVPHEVYGNTQFVCMDPPYNTRRLANKDNSSHDSLSIEEMADVVKEVDAMLRPGGHSVIFCTVQQFVHWQSAFEKYRRLDDRATSIFSVDKAPMFFVNAPNNHNGNPGRASCSLQGMVELALHLKKNGLNYEEEAKMVNYRPFNYIQSSFDGRKNVLNNVPLISGREALMEKVAVTVTDEEDPDYGTVTTRMRKVRPEQKSVQLMKELISRFSQPGDIVVDLFAGTFSAAIAAFALPQHRIFVGCELDEVCFEQAKKRFTTQLAHFLVNPETITDINVPDDVLLSAARISIGAEDSVLQDPNWKAPEGLPQFQRLPLHVLSRLAAISGNHRYLVDQFKSSPDEWPQDMKHALDRTAVADLLAVESAAYNVYVAKSLIRHPKSGQGLFASKPFDENDVICYYYGTLVYFEMGKYKSKTMRYGDTGVMGVSVDRYNHYAMQVKTSGQAFDKVRDYRYGDRSLFVVPPPFCVGSYINDYKYDKDDLDMPKNGDTSTLPFERKPNVAITQVPYPVSSPEKLKETDFLQVVALRQINRGEEFYVDYDRHDFAK